MDELDTRYTHPAASYNTTSPDVPGVRESFPESGRVGCKDKDCFPATMNRHNVNMAMALKNGAVQWRSTGDLKYTNLSHLMVDMLER